MQIRNQILEVETAWEWGYCQRSQFYTGNYAIWYSCRHSTAWHQLYETLYSFQQPVWISGAGQSSLCQQVTSFSHPSSILTGVLQEGVVCFRTTARQYGGS